MWVKHLSSLDFLTYVAFFGVVVAVICRFVPGKPAPQRTDPYSDEELARHDGRLAKYFVAGGGFLVLGAVHMTLKNLPWVADWLARSGYAGHLVRDLSNTHVMIVGGGTLLATGLTWRALPRIVGRPLASDGLAQCAFWLTAVGLSVFYIALVADGIAMSRLVQHGWEYRAAKAHMGKWYKVPVGVGAGIMGLGYWCFAANVLLTVFQARLVRVTKPQGHLWKYFATGGGRDEVARPADRRQRHPHVRRVLAPARDSRSHVRACSATALALRARRLRRARGRHAPGPHPGRSGRQRVARPRRRGGRRDREPARSAEHARRLDDAAHGRNVRAPRGARRAAHARARALGDGRLLRRGDRLLRGRGRARDGRRRLRRRCARARAVARSRARALRRGARLRVRPFRTRGLAGDGGREGREPRRARGCATHLCRPDPR